MILGCHSPSHQWDQHGNSLFPLWVKGTGIKLRVLHKHLRFNKQAREAKLWVEVEVEDRAHKPGFRGLKGMSMPLPPQTEIVDQSVMQGTFLLFHLWVEFYLILVHLIHSLLHCV